MSFDTEAVMVEKLKLLIIEDESRKQTIQEVDLGYGVADLVIVDIKHSVSQGIVPRYALNILNIIRSSPKSYEEILNLTKSSRTLVNKAITYLNDANFILNDNGHYLIRDAYEFIVNSAIAIEVKLSDWKRALYQAYRYKWFANYSYICLPDDCVHLALSNIDLFKTYGVGVMSIGDTIVYHYEPERIIPYDSVMHMLLNEKVKQTLFS